MNDKERGRWVERMMMGKWKIRKMTKIEDEYDKKQDE